MLGDVYSGRNEVPGEASVTSRTDRNRNKRKRPDARKAFEGQKDGWSVKSKRARGLAVQDEIGSGVHDFHVPLGKDHSSLSPDLLGAV